MQASLLALLLDVLGSSLGLAAAAAAPADIAFDTPLASLSAHNTSAFAAYDQAHFPANFGTTAWVSRAGATIAVDPARSDRSLNPTTPGHVSALDVHRLIPSRPDLRWFAHVTPWFRVGGSSHVDIGLDSDSPAYVAALIADVERRGFDGVIVDWYGQGRIEDAFTLELQRQLATRSGRAIAFALMVDRGIPGLSEAVLEAQLAYARARYFADPRYERESGAPLVLFFGVDAALGDDAMTRAKAAAGEAEVWIAQGPAALARSWVDQSFDWTHDVADGVSTTDPYNLAGVAGYYAAVAGSPKHAVGSMSAGFNGTLTGTIDWSLGKHLPRGGGAALIASAARIDAVIPANVTRMQWATWNDWEEGSAIEPGVENDALVVATIDGSLLRWTTTTAGDESTIDHYEIYASRDDVLAADVGSAPVGTRAFDLAATRLVSGTYAVRVLAVGKPAIRDHCSAPAELRLSRQSSGGTTAGGTTGPGVGGAGDAPPPSARRAGCGHGGLGAAALVLAVGFLAGRRRPRRRAGPDPRVAATGGIGRPVRLSGRRREARQSSGQPVAQPK